MGLLRLAGMFYIRHNAINYVFDGGAVCYGNACRCFLLLLLPHFFDAQRMKRTTQERCGDMQKLLLE